MRDQPVPSLCLSLIARPLAHSITMYRSETYNKPTPRFWLYVNAASAVVLVLLYVLTPRIGVGNWIYYHLNPPPEGDGTLYLPLHEFFQDDLDLPNPVFNTPKLRQYMPHNWRGEGQKTFATYLSTRNGSLHDPYFAAAQQLVYRMLWDPEIKYVGESSVCCPSTSLTG